MAYEVRVYRCAEQFLDSQTREMRLHLLGICQELGQDPFVDGEKKFPFPAPPVIFRIWQDGHHWIIYHFGHESEIVHIYNIGRQGIDRPTFHCD